MHFTNYYRKKDANAHNWKPAFFGPGSLTGVKCDISKD